MTSHDPVSPESASTASQSAPMVSVAGIRGIIGESLRPEEFLRYVMAFAASRPKKGPIVVGGDTRPSRHMLRSLVFAGLMSSGRDVLDIGIAPTPTIGMAVKEWKAAGGIALTASHNPLEWNALKFFGPQGQFLTESDNAELRGVLEAEAFDRPGWRGLGAVETRDGAIPMHLDRVLGTVDREAIAARKLRVVVDCCNGAGVDLTTRLLDALGCEAVLFATNPDEAFHRVAEPLPQHLGALSERVKAERADLGFALDPDADRLAIVDETGRPIGEERTLCLATDAILARRSPSEGGMVVANLSTTMAYDLVAEAHGAKVERTKIGEAHVVEGMRRTAATIGGEGNGGVIFPDVHLGRDAATGMALVLDGLARRGGTTSEWNATYPDFAMLKEKLPVGSVDLPVLLEAVRSEFAVEESHCSRLDGLKLHLDKLTIHLRPSGTEPIVRIFIEAGTIERAEAAWSRVQQVVAAASK